jgi:hypothetical protein
MDMSAPAGDTIPGSKAGLLSLNSFQLNLIVFDARLLAFNFEQARAAPQHPVEFVSQQRDCFVTLVGFNDRVHRRSVDEDMPFGLEPGPDFFLGVVFQLYAQAHNVLLVAKQPIRFLANEGLQRRGQFEMNAGDDQFVIVLSVHVAAVLWLTVVRPEAGQKMIDALPLDFRAAMQLKLRQIACEMSDCTTFTTKANRPDRRVIKITCSTFV